jgi:hypothetical protein
VCVRVILMCVIRVSECVVHVKVCVCVCVCVVHVVCASCAHLCACTVDTCAQFLSTLKIVFFL